MSKHIIYKIFSFLLLPIGAIFGLFTLIFLVVALSNPGLLLFVFVLACVVIYIITSFMFLNKVIMNRQRAKKGLKDWIKVNAFGAVVFAIATIYQVGSILLNPKLKAQVLSDFMATQPPNAQLTKAMMQNIAEGMLYFLVGFSVVLIIHVFSTLFLLKKYAPAFEEPSANDPE